MAALPPLRPLTRLNAVDFESPAVLRKTATAGRKLAELKGLASSIPNQGILINTLGLQEAKDSSAIENIVTSHDEPALWQEWVLYMLTAVEETAAQAIVTVADIKAALMDYKHRIRGMFKFYSQDLINNLFMHPYTKIEFVERDLKVSRLTAAKYLGALDEAGFVRKVKVGRSNYYINAALSAILTRAEMVDGGAA